MAGSDLSRKWPMDRFTGRTELDDYRYRLSLWSGRRFQLGAYFLQHISQGMDSFYLSESECQTDMINLSDKPAEESSMNIKQAGRDLVKPIFQIFGVDDSLRSVGDCTRSAAMTSTFCTNLIPIALVPLNVERRRGSDHRCDP